MLISEIIAMVVDAVIGTGQMAGPYGLVVGIFVLAVIIPHIAVGIRRLHDTDHSGWWLLMFLLPIIGPIVLLVFFCTEGDQGPNRFGEDPYGSDTLEEVFA